MKTENNGRLVRPNQQGNQLATTDGKKDLAPVDVMANTLSRMRGAMEQVLPRHMTADRMVRVAIMAVRTTPHLAECSSASVISCFMACSMLGLEPNSPLHQAYLIPYWSTKLNGYECQLIIDYRGKIDLARRSGEIAGVQAHAVYEGDDFDYGLGLEPFLRHKPKGKRSDPSKLTHAYCVVKLKEQGTDPIFVVLDREQIELRRKRGASGKTDRKGKPIHTPWDTDYEKMAKKTVVHECMTWAPRSAEMAMADDIEERTERGAPILPALPDSVTDALLASGAASSGDMDDDPVDIDPEQGDDKKPEAVPEQKSSPKAETPSLSNEEIRAMKKSASASGDVEIVSLCEAALQADPEAIRKLAEIRDAGTQM